MFEDLRTLQLLDWLENDLLLPVEGLLPAAGDASFRRYFRVVVGDGSFVAMDAPPAKETLAPFIQVAGLLAAAGVRVPAIHQQNLADGFLLLEDFGSRHFLDCLSADSAPALYQRALDHLLCWQRLPVPEGVGLPRYDEALLRRELAIFNDWCLQAHLDVAIPAALWEALQALLVDSALAQPYVFVHRDYHSRNLMVLADGEVGVLDFQDALMGPVTYDLVSLLRDCYIGCPQALLEGWLRAHQERLVLAGVPADDPALFRRWFDWMGVQRHLKAIGIFCRLHWRDGKSGYLGHIPRTLGYVRAVCADYPELAGFGRFLAAEVQPRLDGR